MKPQTVEEVKKPTCYVSQQTGSLLAYGISDWLHSLAGPENDLMSKKHTVHATFVTTGLSIAWFVIFSVLNWIRGPERQPAEQSPPGNSCDGAGTNHIGYCFPIGPFQRRGERDYSPSSISTLPRLRALESTLSTADLGMQRRHNRGGSSLPNINLLLDLRKAWRQGLFRTVWEVITSHWAATARLRLGSPLPVRCCPASAR